MLLCSILFQAARAGRGSSLRAQDTVAVLPPPHPLTLALALTLTPTPTLPSTLTLTPTLTRYYRHHNSDFLEMGLVKVAFLYELVGLGFDVLISDLL